MNSKAIVVALVGLGCIGAAGVGAYLAVKSSTPDPVAASGPQVVTPSGESAASAASAPSRPAGALAAEGAEAAAVPQASDPAARTTARDSRETSASSKPGKRSEAVPSSVPVAVPRAPEEPVAPVTAEDFPVATDVAGSPVELPAPPPAVERTVPIASVIGIRLDTGVSSESARVEDRVLARVTRDVKVDGETAIPAGARLEGYVTVVEHGGKLRDRARVGVRFTTLILGDTDRVPIQTETIFRDGEPPTNEATSKIGASAVVGAILGAVIGGKKGAAIGGTAGAAGGTAAVMAGDRNEASIPAGSPLTVRLTAPVSVLVPRDQ